MGYLEEQRKRVEQSTTAPYQRVLLALGSSDTCKICALEGVTDLPFYDPLLRAYARARDVVKPRSVHCGSKDNVLRTRRRLARYDDRVAYVIDKDHTNYVPGMSIEDDNVFVTKFYSVESYSVGLNHIADLTSALFRLEPDSDLIASLAQRFDVSFRQFHGNLKKLHSIAIALKRNGLNVHLSDVPSHKVFVVSQDNFQWSGANEEEVLRALFAECGVDWENVQNALPEAEQVADELDQIEPLDWLHGKFVLYHFTRFLGGWYRSNKKMLDQYGRTPTVTADLNEAFILNFVANFHAEVSEFSEFLDARFAHNAR